MNMKIFAFLLVIVAPMVSWGSQFPEKKIIELEKTVEKEKKVEILWDIVKITYRLDLDTALYFAKEQHQLANLLNNKRQIVNATWAMALIHKKKGFLRNAATYLFQAHDMYLELDDLKNIAVSLYHIGQVFIAGKDYNNAILYLNQAIDNYQRLEDFKKLANVNYDLARCLLELDQFKKAIYHLDQSLIINQKARDSTLTSKIYNYLGATYFNMKEYDEAIKEYFLSMKAAEGLEDFKKKSAIAYNNIGESYLYSGDLENAEQYLLKALALKKELGDHDFTLSTQVLLSRLAIKKKEYDKALDYLQEGILVADKSVINPNLMDALDEIIALNEQQPIVKLPADQIISYFKFENQQARLLRGLNDELGSLNSQYVLKNAFETYQLSEANSSLTDQLSQSKVIIILTVLLSLFTGILSVYYVRKYLVLKEFKQETTLGLELISHQLERTIKMASKK